MGLGAGDVDVGGHAVSTRILCGDARAVLKTLPPASVHCVVTSPPYFGLRSYNGGAAEIGLEQTPAEYVAALVDVFSEVWRVLRNDGTVWLNLGDSYVNNPSTSTTPRAEQGNGQGKLRIADEKHYQARRRIANLATPIIASGSKKKDLIGIPWRVAFALQDAGWYLRNDIIWIKPNPMPESVTDRCTRSHEYIFHLAKSERYYFDAAAIAEPAQEWTGAATTFQRENSKRALPIVPGQRYGTHRPNRKQDAVGSRRYAGFNARWDAAEEAGPATTRNKRSVWTVATFPWPEAHFATFPEKLVEPCILAGCPAGGTVLDPFAGSGTTLLVAKRLGRTGIGVELNPEYVAMAERRVNSIPASLFAQTEAVV